MVYNGHPAWSVKMGRGLGIQGKQPTEGQDTLDPMAEAVTGRKNGLVHI